MNNIPENLKHHLMDGDVVHPHLAGNVYLEETLRRIAELRTYITRWRKEYYADNPSASDSQYDSFKRELHDKTRNTFTRISVDCPSVEANENPIKDETFKSLLCSHSTACEKTIKDAESCIVAPVGIGVKITYKNRGLHHISLPSGERLDASYADIFKLPYKVSDITPDENEWDNFTVEGIIYVSYGDYSDNKTYFKTIVDHIRNTGDGSEKLKARFFKLTLNNKGVSIETSIALLFHMGFLTIDLYAKNPRKAFRELSKDDISLPAKFNIRVPIEDNHYALVPLCNGRALWGKSII